MNPCAFTNRWSGPITAQTLRKSLPLLPAPLVFGSGAATELVTLATGDGSLLHSCQFGINAPDDWQFVEYEVRAELGGVETVVQSGVFAADVIQNQGVGPETGRVIGFLPVTSGRPCTKFTLSAYPNSFAAAPDGQFNGVAWGDHAPGITSDRAQRMVVDNLAGRGQRFQITQNPLTALDTTLVTPFADNRTLFITSVAVGSSTAGALPLSPPEVVELRSGGTTVAAFAVADGNSRTHNFQPSPLFFGAASGVRAVIGDVASSITITIAGYGE